MVTSNNSPSKSFKLLFWNILCDQYAYYWKTAPQIELKYKQWKYRQELFKKLLSDSSTISDCYCFVEVDKQNDLLAILNSIENTNQYKCIYSPRPNTPLGQCIIFNQKKFTLIETFQYNLTNDPKLNFALVACLKDICQGYSIGILVTHLTAWEKHEDKRISQVKTMLSSIAKDKRYETYAIDKFIICGDYNASPSADCVKLMSENYKSVFELKKDLHTIVIDTIDEGIKKLYFDYIFYSGSLTVLNKAMPVEYLDFSKGIPNENFPSDHIYLSCEIGVDN